MPAKRFRLVHVVPPSAVLYSPSVELSAHALFGSAGCTASFATSARPLTFAQVAPPSVLRQTPAGLAAQITAGSLGATTTALTAPPSGPEEVQPANDVDARRKRERRKGIGLIDFGARRRWDTAALRNLIRRCNGRRAELGARCS